MMTTTKKREEGGGEGWRGAGERRGEERRGGGDNNDSTGDDDDVRLKLRQMNTTLKVLKLWGNKFQGECERLISALFLNDTLIGTLPSSLSNFSSIP